MPHTLTRSIDQASATREPRPRGNVIVDLWDLPRATQGRLAQARVARAAVTRRGARAGCSGA